MAIYLKELANKSSKFTFPSMPNDGIDVQAKTSYQEYEFIRKGRFSFPSGMDKQPIKWSGYFFGESRKKLSGVIQNWMEPKTCIAKLKKWQQNGTPLNLIVSDSNINSDVTISSFTYKPFGGHGDYSYTIEFLPYYELKIYTTKELGVEKKAQKKKTDTRSNKKKGNSSKTKKNTKTYTIKSGDTLWGISTKYYGTGSKWQTIYNKNKSTIEAAARRYGYSSSNGGNWIFPGTTLTIP